MMTKPSSPVPPVRPPAWAGRFYPAAAAELRDLVDAFLANAPPSNRPAPKAVIAPHAGYIYSGPIAASAYVCLRPGHDRVRRVVLIGPSHYADFTGLATSPAQAFATPLGEVPVDQEAVALLGALPQVRFSAEAHAPEHCLEVQLPFLQRLFSAFEVVPLLAGWTSDAEISEVLERLWGGSETRIIVSSDLSHYHPYATARALDERTARAIEQLDYAGLRSDDACGCRPIRGLLLAARHRGLHAATVDLRNSGDTAGPRDRVVGYGAFVFGET
jgi:hypothetical protein